MTTRAINVQNGANTPSTTAQILIENKIDYTPKVSVIIPVYNVEKYLRQCLDSVVAQTLKEIEIICVDDGSTDSSLEILKEYAIKDPRFTIITQKNSGPGKARNNGIDIAKGEYIAFVDSDDWVELDTYEKTYESAKKENVPLVCFNAKRVSKRNNEKGHNIVYYKKNKHSKSNWQSIENLIFDYPFHSWHFLYNRSLINNFSIRYPELTVCEDVPFVLKALLEASEIYFMPEYFYNYYVRTNSSCNKTTVKTLDIFDVIDIVKKTLIKYDNKVLNLKFKKWINLHLFRIIKRSGKEVNQFLENYLLYKSQSFIDKDELNKFIFNKINHISKGYLFGFIPIVIKKDTTYNTKVKLFNLTILKVKRFQYSTKYYFLGVLIYTIKRDVL